MLYNLLISAPKGFPDSSSGKELTCQCKRHKRPEFNPGSGGSPGGGNGNPLQYSCLGNSEDRGACRATVHRVAKSWTQLSMHTCTDLKLSKRTSSMISGPLLMRYREVSHHSLWPWVISLFLFLSVFAVIQLLSHVWLFVTPWTAACQASLSFSISQSLLKLVSIESVMPSNYLILCCPLLLLPLIFPSIRIFIIYYQSLSVFKYVQLPLSYKTKQKLLLNRIYGYSPWRMISCLLLNFSTLLYSFTPDNCPSSPLYLKIPRSMLTFLLPSQMNLLQSIWSLTN